MREAVFQNINKLYNGVNAFSHYRGKHKRKRKRRRRRKSNENKCERNLIQTKTQEKGEFSFSCAHLAPPFGLASQITKCEWR